MKQLNIYTDGACKGNPGIGGWAWIIKGKPFMDYGAEESATNNSMELTAILQCTDFVIEKGLFPEELNIITDSQYSISVLTGWFQNWQKTGQTTRKSYDLANRIVANLETIVHSNVKTKIQFLKVKGHSGDTYNEFADKLANKAISEFRLKLSK